MPESAPPPDLTALPLTALAEEVAARRLPPVESWHPTHCGDSAMRIDRDGRWYHEGTPIERPAMVRLFATLLRREPDGSFVLVTPVEKLSIAVEDAPFVAIELRSEGQGRDRTLAFRLNTDEVVIAGPDHALRLGGERPYLEVRAGLDALIARPVYYELADMALAEGNDPPAVWSCGAFFPLSVPA